MADQINYFEDNHFPLLPRQVLVSDENGNTVKRAVYYFNTKEELEKHPLADFSEGGAWELADEPYLLVIDHSCFTYDSEVLIFIEPRSNIRFLFFNDRLLAVIPGEL
jgi:hypothetical protein